MTATMRAWRSPAETGIAALRIVEMAIPEPAAGEVVVEVDAAALNFSDLLMIDGAYQIRPDRPFTPGQEIAGTVSRCGPATDLAPGTRVAGKVKWGGFAEYAVLRADMAIVVPDRIDSVHAVALPVVYTTALVALVEEAGLKEGDTVLIHAAAGGVGLAAVQIAKAYGARVIAAATGKAKCELVQAHGADVAVDYGAEDFVAAVADATGGAGADIILDSVGGEVTLKSLRCLARGGQLLIVGFSSGEIAEIPANRLLLRRAVARGIYWDHDRDAEMVARCVATLIELCLDGRIRPVVDDRYGFDEAPRALEDLGAGRSVGKLVLRMT
jgi:NADPH2:quinone reductase